MELNADFVILEPSTMVQIVCAIWDSSETEINALNAMIHALLVQDLKPTIVKLAQMCP